MNKLQERLINGLWAQAVCDAVGDPFEFKRNIKPESVSNFAQKATSFNITDDTQMALFGFEAIHDLPDDALITSPRFESVFTLGYLGWYQTQVGNFNDRLQGLRQFKNLWEQRAPGNTCLQALNELEYHGTRKKNDSKGCGSVMRLLPAMAFDQGDDCEAAKLVAGIMSDVTHDHPENVVACDIYVKNAHALLHTGKQVNTFETLDSIWPLGTGWTALECVNMALWSVYHAKTFDQLLELSIAHDGDSDSVGAVAGSLWGLAGREVPQEYIDKLVEKDAIQFCIDTYILAK